MGEKKRPRRYRLYDKIPVSLKTMDWIIYGIVGAIVVALAVGVFVWR